MTQPLLAGHWLEVLPSIHVGSKDNVACNGPRGLHFMHNLLPLRFIVHCEVNLDKMFIFIHILWFRVSILQKVVDEEFVELQWT